MRARATLTLEDRKGQTVPSLARCEAPLAFSWSRNSEEDTALLYMLNQAGLILGGDSFKKKITLKKNARAILTTQSYSKISRGDGSESREITDILLEKGAVLEWISDPCLFFSESASRQWTRIAADGNSSILWISGQMMGRKAGGEWLEFENSSHNFEVLLDKKQVFLERWHLQPGKFKKEIETLMNPYSILGFALFTFPGPDKTAEISGLCEQENEAILPGFTSLSPNLKIVKFLARDGSAYRKFSLQLWETARLSLLGRRPPDLGKQ